MLAYACIVAALARLPAQAADTIQTLATSYQPTLSERVDASGFKHPGIGFTKEILENMRTQVRAQKEPWNTYFNNMLLSGSALKSPSIKNVNAADASKPRYYGLSAQGIEALFISDAQTAYTQAILYFVTGGETYRANAMRVIRLYAQMDPSQYAPYADAHIHTGIPLSRMVGAAEILRYTSTQTPALAWTDDDTARFTANLVIPVIQTFNSCNCRFMNQHLYTTIAAMSGYIFAENREKYNEAVEWFTVNKHAQDQGQNGSIKQLFRMVTRNDLTGEAVTPVVQHVEMGRDQAHGAGDITNAEILARLMMGQGTRVDPVEGTVSTAANAVGPYEFLNDRILDAAELFGSYMSGHEIPWVPTASHTDAYGNPTVVYRDVSGNYRGRTGSNTWELFYYYQYVRGIDMLQRAPNFSKFFAKRAVYNWDSGDGGGDFWLFIPKEAALAEGATYLVKPITDPYREVEDRFTPLDGNSVAVNDAAGNYVRVTATPEGSRLVVFGYGYGAPSYGIRIRTDGMATLESWGSTFPLPDTKGQWRYVIIPGGVNDYLPYIVRGNGTTVDIDHLHIQVASLLTPPVFTVGNADLTLYTYAGTTLTTTLNFSATDAGAGDVVSYQADGLPQGASFNTASGAFSWKPAVAGSYTFVIGASDGKIVTVKKVTIVVDADRQAAVNTANAPYNPATLYVASSLPAYNSANADMASVIGSASDDIFFQKLTALRNAVAALQELTPLLSDGSISFAKLLYASDMGAEAGAYVDGNPGSSVNYNKARNGGLTMDFGPGFKVAANLFQLQAVQTFPERGGGIAIFGSNDNENWTRLTPGLTGVVDEMQTLPVQEDQKNQRYRFVRIQVLQQTSSLLQLGEFRIFGTRFESVNKITAVSISSDQSLRRRVISGDTVKLAFVTNEAVNNVVATIQGMPAVITSADNLNWTATAIVNAATAPGTVKFLVNYKTAGGVDAEPTFLTTDATSLFVSDQTNYLANLLSITTVTDSSGRNTTDALNMVGRLFDKNLGSATDYRIGSSGAGSWVAFDFRGGGTARLSRAEIIGNQDQYYTRVNGAVIQGSNDYASWTTISNAAGATMDWQTLTISDPTPYRYIRVANGNNWFGTMTELRLYGVAESTNMIASASLSSAQALRTRIVPGNTVKLSFTAKQAISNVSATIAGVAATVGTTDNINFTATATLPQGVAAGAVSFLVNYKGQSGTDGYPLSATTDGSSLNLVDEMDVIKNFGTLATLIDSTTGRSAASTLSMVNALVDGNLFTGSDFRNGTSSGSGAYIAFDFKAGNQVNLSNVEVIGSQDTYSSRMAGVVIQGSNDGAAWTTLTPGAVNTQEWQNLKVASLVPYRYIRIYNAAAWFGTMREVRLHGSLHTADTTAPATQANAPGVTVGATTTVTLSATDSGSGVQATYYTVDGGAQKTGSSIVIPADGPHTLAYWSVDWSGNVEQKNTLEVTLDKTAPVLAGLYADLTTPTNQNVTVTVYYPLDAAVKEVKLGETGTWTAYTAPLILTDNGTVYARSTDAVGNVSAIASLAVANINKIPPAGAGLAVSNTEPTTGNVTVTITYPANVAVRQYRIGSGAWTAYTGPLTLTENGIVYAQSIDAVGNVSPVTSYAVTNIDRVAPADAGFAADFTEPTRNDVTVAVLFPADAAIREYRIGADGEWKAYGAPILMSANGVVFARSADAAGNQSGVTQYTVGNIDRIAPAGAALALDTTAPTNQAVSVTITWPDDAVFKEVRVGEGEWTPFTTGAVVVAEDSTVFARSSDAVGNRSNETSIVVSNIFKVVPTTNATLNPASPNGKNTWYTSDVSVTLAVNPGSYGGAVTTEYQVNGGAWTASTGAAIVFGEGVHQLGFRSRDQAGNAEQVKTIVFKVDKTLPTLSVALDKTMIWPPNHQLVTINAALGAADAGSGIDSVILTNITSSKPDSGRGGDVEAEFGQPVSSFAVRAEKGSVYTVSYTATDKAGNKTVKTATVTVPQDPSGL
jgi:large repetitive protein